MYNVATFDDRPVITNSTVKLRLCLCNLPFPNHPGVMNTFKIYLHAWNIETEAKYSAHVPSGCKFTYRAYDHSSRMREQCSTAYIAYCVN